MPLLNLAGAERVTELVNSQPAPAELAERCLRWSPYLALRSVSCECREGVLVLRGCLPSYYLKQVAQEVVARLEGVETVDNQIQVVAPARPQRQG
jgi:osmotically-inducible protein OsmY